jgi:hypothetical protein
MEEKLELVQYCTGNGYSSSECSSGIWVWKDIFTPEPRRVDAGEFRNLSEFLTQEEEFKARVKNLIEGRPETDGLPQYKKFLEE